VHFSASDGAHRTEIWRSWPASASNRCPLFGIACLVRGIRSVIATTGAPMPCTCAPRSSLRIHPVRLSDRVVLLILLMPVSGSVVFRHEMFGVTGIIRSICGCWLRSALIWARAVRRHLKHFVPQPLLCSMSCRSRRRRSGFTQSTTSRPFLHAQDARVSQQRPTSDDHGFTPFVRSVHVVELEHLAHVETRARFVDMA